MIPRRIRYALVALVVVGSTAVGWRLAGNPMPKASTPLAPVAKAPTVFELTPAETLVATSKPLTQTVAFSGTIKAAKTAIVKVRVAGEITGLTLREGDTVKAGHIVARIDPTEVNARLRQAKDQAEAARAQVDIAQRQYDNNQSLVQQGFISKTALDNAVASLAGAKANFQAAKAAVDLAQRNLDDTVLRAPISGAIAAKGLQNGERASVDARVLEIVDLSTLELEAILPAQDAVAVHIGQTALVTVEGVTNAAISAKVIRINPSVQASNRGVVVYLSVTPNAALKHGLFAQGQLALTSMTTLAIPLAAVRIDQPKPYVQAIVAGKVVHMPVEMGVRGEVAGVAFVAVQGLAEGTQLLSGTVGQVRQGTPVKVVGK